MKGKNKTRRYLVELTREVRYVATVEVEAVDEADAKEKAEEAADAPNSGEWVEDHVVSQTVDVKVYP